MRTATLQAVIDALEGADIIENDWGVPNGADGVLFMDLVILKSGPFRKLSEARFVPDDSELRTLVKGFLVAIPENHPLQNAIFPSAKGGDPMT